KLSPVGLGDLLEKLPANHDPDLLVGFSTRDDAAVYRLDAETALVMTADIITPPVDDPFLFGQIAAANALSDIYAMGGKPLVCLNLIGFPAKKLDGQVLFGMVEGALSKVTEAGAVLAGGHTTEDREPKFGLSVTGIVHPEKIWTNAGARVGDTLIMTRPIGSGVLFNANQKGLVSPGAMDECLEVITTLNKAAAETMAGFPAQGVAHGVTDVTGFGLAGHALEMAEGSDVALRIEVAAVPVLDEALDMYRRGITTGVNDVNRQLVESKWRFDSNVDVQHREIFVDPQTSGGLLAAVDTEHVSRLLDALGEAGVPARKIGEVIPFDGQARLIFY
ncbi:MAG: selenide, water dikinase SelD, partial [Gemmatimonadota bacterium]